MNNYDNNFINPNMYPNNKIINFNDQTIENILNLNKGKQVSIYTTFPGADEWKNKQFSGIIENSGKDHLTISEPATGIWHLLPINCIDFITFNEQINHQ